MLSEKKTKKNNVFKQRLNNLLNNVSRTVPPQRNKIDFGFRFFLLLCYSFLTKFEKIHEKVCH